jgi:hypothetical protein
MDPYKVPTNKKLAALQALGAVGDVDRERFLKVISVLAVNSPEAITGKDGAKAGMLTFRGETPPYRSFFVGLPIFEHMLFVEWPAERSKGAPIANHIVRPAQATPDVDGDFRMPNGNRIVKTRYLYVAVADRGTVVPNFDTGAGADELGSRVLRLRFRIALPDDDRSRWSRDPRPVVLLQLAVRLQAP